MILKSHYDIMGIVLLYVLISPGKGVVAKKMLQVIVIQDK